MLKIIRTLYLLVNSVIIIALLSIHFVLKESSYQNSLLFYTFPLPVIITIVLGLTIFLSKTFRKYNLLLAGALLLFWLGRSFKIHIPEEINESDIEVVFWNASHERNLEDAFNISGNIPDVFVLVEHGKYSVDRLQSKYSDYYFYKSINGISVFSKLPIELIGDISSNYGTNIVNFETYNINFYAVDVSGSMDVPREWELTFVNEYVEQKTQTILLGDFNVPFESKLLDNIKNNFNHAFNEKGNGFRETWFWNIPLLSLDHIWVSRDLKVLKTEKIGTFKSDHNMLKTVVKK
ncbi:endonuclease/exonuclease/phosphatase family protein [Porticoccaceae bacterium]|nr:endonuclease/exonuclease/phosphatase family protein [Porticoccaceae bacterium]